MRFSEEINLHLILRGLNEYGETNFILCSLLKTLISRSSFNIKFCYVYDFFNFLRDFKIFIV